MLYVIVQSFLQRLSLLPAESIFRGLLAVHISGSRKLWISALYPFENTKQHPGIYQITQYGIAEKWKGHAVTRGKPRKVLWILGTAKPYCEISDYEKKYRRS